MFEPSGIETKEMSIPDALEFAIDVIISTREDFLLHEGGLESDDWIFESAAAEQALNDLYHKITFNEE